MRRIFESILLRNMFFPLMKCYYEKVGVMSILHWSSCTYFALVKLYIFCIGQAVHILHWSSCTYFALVKLYIFCIGQAVHILHWSSCTYFALVKLYIFSIIVFSMKLHRIRTTKPTSNNTA